jgi:hypothetical protein
MKAAPVLTEGSPSRLAPLPVANDDPAQLPGWPGLAGARVRFADVDPLRAGQAAFAVPVRPRIGQHW